MRYVSKRFSLIAMFLIVFSIPSVPAGRVNALAPLTNQWVDSFSTATLQNAWTILNENAVNWAINSGTQYLQITTETFAVETDQQHEPKNQFMTTLPPGDFRAMTFVLFNPTVSTQIAGLRVRQSPSDYLEIHLTAAAGTNQLNWDINRAGTLERHSTDFAGNAVYLTITRSGAVYTAAYKSTDPGDSWHTVGSYTVTYTTPWVGMIAGNSQAGDPIPAGFDFLRVDFAALPLAVTYTDHFNGTLTPGWRWVHEAAEHHSLTARPGFLKITPVKESGISAIGSNLILRTAPGKGKFGVETHLFFEPSRSIENAGLLLYQDDTNTMMLGLGYCDYPTCHSSGRAIFFDYVVDGVYLSANYAVPYAGSEVWLRLDREGTFYSAYYSIDGYSWSLVGRHYAQPGFVPTDVGLKTFTMIDGHEIDADFDYVNLRSWVDIYLPSVLR